MDPTDTDELIAIGADVWAVLCNYRDDTKHAAEGARAYLVWTTGGMRYEHQQIYVRSRGGRWVTMWEASYRLTNFRPKCIPAGHPIRQLDAATRQRIELYPNRAAAEARATEMREASRRIATARRAR